MAAITAEVSTHEDPTEALPVVNSQVNAVVGAAEVLLMARHVRVRGHKEGEALVLFDQGSQTSFVTEKLAAKLGLKRVSQSQMQVSGFQSSKPITFRSTRYALRLHRVDGGYEEVIVNSTSFITSPIRPAPAGAVREESTPEEVERQLHDIMSGPVIEPEILLGIPDFWKVFQTAKKIEHGLYLVDTTVGPMICGGDRARALEETCGLVRSMVTVAHPTSDDMPPMEAMSQLWGMEGIGVTENPADQPDELAMQQFEASVRRVDGRIEVGWPWKDAAQDLPTNFQLCYGRLLSVYRRLEKDPELLTAYDKLLREQLGRGVTEEVVEGSGAKGPIHYLPHQPVVTTKLRIVYDASAHIKGKRSLNDCLYRGPIRLPALAGMLMRFRMARVAVIADVEKAFLQLGLAEADRDVTRFLWLHDVRRPPSPENLWVLRFTRVAFGVISSPFLLQESFRYHLLERGGELGRWLVDNTYVDNLFLQADSVEGAMALVRETKSVFAEASMNVRDFLSNSAEVNELIPAEDRLDGSKAKVLGLKWDTVEDRLVIPFDLALAQERPGRPRAPGGPMPGAGPITRRWVLKALGTTFDPLGLVAPALLEAKLMFQTLWGTTHSWDHPLAEEESQRWNEIVAERVGVSLVIPRLMKGVLEGVQIHVFTDASARAYGAAAYLRLSDGNGGWSTYLVFTRNRLAPCPCHAWSCWGYWWAHGSCPTYASNSECRQRKQCCGRTHSAH